MLVMLLLAGLGSERKTVFYLFFWPTVVFVNLSVCILLIHMAYLDAFVIYS